MKKESVVVSPDIYNKINKPNCLNLNNSFLSKQEYLQKEGLNYKREGGLDNYHILNKVLSSLYGIKEEQSLILSSGIAIATILNHSNLFNRILYPFYTYPDMKMAYSGIELEIINEIQENDLICIESYEIPSCKNNKDIIEKYVKEAKDKNAFVLVDNTYSTFYNFNPFKLGVDFVLESLSKHVCGFNSSLGGILLSSERGKYIFQKLNSLKNSYGLYIDPINCYLIQLGLQTLPIRLNRIQNTTNNICNFLSANSIIFSAIKELGMIFIKCSKKFAYEIIDEIKVFQHVDSFGVNFTTLTYFKDEEILRLSIGLEDQEDLITSLTEVVSYLKVGQV